MNFTGRPSNFPLWGSLPELYRGHCGGTYGIGGGAIIAPFFVTVFGLPVYTVAGAALMGTFITSFAGVGFYQLIAPWYPQQAVSPDWLLGILFGSGGMAGMYLGARTRTFVADQVDKDTIGDNSALSISKLYHRLFQIGWPRTA